MQQKYMKSDPNANNIITLTKSKMTNGRKSDKAKLEIVTLDFYPYFKSDSV